MHISPIYQFLTIIVSASLVQAINFDWNCTKSLATCNNACFAINCNGSPSQLNYDSNTANRGPRRTASGCNRTPCSTTRYSASGNSCDEYPFASTIQGGAGATLRCVDQSENHSQGGQLARFSKSLSDGDQFGIVIFNYAGAGFCTDTQTCVNDDYEFNLQNGIFVNAKGENSQLVPAKSSHVGVPFRKFMGEDGIQRLWLSTDTEGTIMRDYVWGGQGKEVKIISEIFT